MKEKANAVKKQGTLEYFDTQEGADDIGGLDVLKRWVDKRSMAFSKKARTSLTVALPISGRG